MNMIFYVDNTGCAEFTKYHMNLNTPMERAESLGDSIVNLWIEALGKPASVDIYMPENNVNFRTSKTIKRYKTVDQIQLPKDHHTVLIPINMIPTGKLFGQHFIDGYVYEYNGLHFGKIRTLDDFGTAKNKVQSKDLPIERITNKNLSLILLSLIKFTKVRNDVLTNNKIFGDVVILSPNVKNCKVYGPCFIDADSTLSDSVLAAGTVILNSTVQNTEILDGTIINSSIIESHLVSCKTEDSELYGVNLKESYVSSGTRLLNGKN